MITSLLLGFFVGVVVCLTFVTYISPRLEQREEVKSSKNEYEATFWEIETQRRGVEFYKEYPELLDGLEEDGRHDSSYAVGFEYYPEEEHYDEEN